MSILNPATACQFTIPASINFNRRKELDKLLRKEVPNRYRGMKGNTLFFDWPSGKERDTFLVELGAMLEKRGQAYQTVQ